MTSDRILRVMEMEMIEEEDELGVTDLNYKKIPYRYLAHVE